MYCIPTVPYPSQIAPPPETACRAMTRCMAQVIKTTLWALSSWGASGACKGARGARSRLPMAPPL
eukprot:3491561-Lingulodinium_polyedra.AAC.1